jgi:hypothetical protein
MIEEIKRYDPYTDKFIKNTTTDRIKVGTDGRLYNLSLSNSYGLYAKNQEELDKCDYIDKSTKLYTKDEVISMLTEIQTEIEEKKTDYDKDLKIEHGIYHAYNRCSEVIQQKINSLKEK